jgi:hypothetical protein
LAPVKPSSAWTFNQPLAIGQRRLNSLDSVSSHQARLEAFQIIRSGKLERSVAS